ncbi:hypothetical protein EUX98_g3249 [Antrodiella citrinella]|uniref:Rho-GAP domain-containing protein n=1 Tax=Antrodiella citrinella TaxID=2447956 RepID=A0A4S4MWZ5_9APHY|nr:hypothetical protein EUX98_g3249 [Antrodiella citrinella]
MPVVLPSHSQTSLSSFSSDASSSNLPPGPIPASNSSSSDIAFADQTLPSSAPSKSRFFPLSKSSAPRAPHSLTQQMGQTLSRPDPVVLTPSNESISGGNRFKRVWQGRRKKSEDVAVLLGGQSPVAGNGKGKERDFSTPSPTTPLASKGAEAEVQQSQLPPRQTKGTKNFIPLQLSSSFNVFGGNRRQSQSPKSPKFSGSPPLQTPLSSASDAFVDKKLPLTPTPTPPSTARLATFSQSSLTSLPSTDHVNKCETNPAKDKADLETKQDWRKSDSTVASRITVRPGTFGNRSPRPVSLAESSHSGHTVVAVNKRLSALITDADFAMPEEGDLDGETGMRGTGRPSPTPSLKAIHRRSMSLSPGYGLRMKSGSPEPLITSEPHSFSSPSSPISPIMSAKNTPTLTRAAAEGFITPTSTPGAAHSTSSNIRGRLAAWSATTAPPPSSAGRVNAERPLPTPPPPQPRVATANHPSVSHPPSFRQTAVSMTGSLAPTAAGIAIGIGKRVHRVWGGFSSSSSSQSAYSSTSSVDQMSNGSQHCHTSRPEDGLGARTAPQVINQPSAKSGWRGKRGTPNAPSGTWSVASSTASSASESEALTMPSGPNLGTRLRGPMLNASGSAVAGGLVFGRKLDICVQQTSIDRRPDVSSNDGGSGIRPLEERDLPALVIRCAQHLLQWGVQEEGLFRVSGRPAHVAKLRSEFDTGADYNLVESDPGDLDPHAVASIFKAYLRELPESLLTSALVSQFETIMVAENTEAEAALARPGGATPRGVGSKGPTLPSGPRVGISLRKPPSLSTLAMPNFAGMRTISPAGLDAITALIARLPKEHRDLLLTVAELITATAARSKETKMPIGNLLVVFCPSLNMNPSLLRVFCDSKEIWTPPPKLPEVTTEVPSITLNADKQDLKPIEEMSDLPAARPRRGGGTTRDPLATLYVPNDQSIASIYQRSSSNSGSYVSALEGPTSPDTRPSTPSLGSPRMPPPLSSSTDSLATPSTMSEASSFSQPPSLSSQASSVEPTKPELVISAEPVIVLNADLALPNVPRRPAISNPIPFPCSSDGSAPHTPLSSRKSFLLSFPPLRSAEGNSSSASTHVSSTSSLGNRTRSKRPSLHLLFSKKSSPNLKATSLQRPSSSPNSAPPMTSDYPQIPPVSTTTFSSDLVAPSLTTPISSSPMDLGFDDHLLVGTAAAAAEVEVDGSKIAPEDTIRLVHVRTDSTISSLYSTPQETPVANRFRLPSAVSLSATTDPKNLPRSPSQLSLTPSITMGFGDEDWAQSVLMAAGSDAKVS